MSADARIDLLRRLGDIARAFEYRAGINEGPISKLNHADAKTVREAIRELSPPLPQRVWADHLGPQD